MATLALGKTIAAQRLKPEDFLPDMNVQPVEPVHIIGNIYYVGTNGVSSFLIVTPDGHILLDSGFDQYGAPDPVRAWADWGFRFEDVRILLSTHAHFDHVAGHAWIQEQTGARIIASAPDAGSYRARRREPVGGLAAKPRRYSVSFATAIASDSAESN